MKLSVIILNYNVRYFLEQAVRSVQQAISSIEAEIIVIDNNSSDNSCEMMKELFPNIRLIENSENVGFSKANNQAVAEASGEYVCILNPDTAVPHSIFSNCFQYISEYENLGILGVRLIDGTGNFLPESKRNIPTPKSALTKLLGRGEKSNGYYANNLGDTETGEVPILPGAFMMVKRSIFNEAGGFDEDYFMYGEDIDFSYKVLQAGYKNHYLGTDGILHYKGESPQNDSAYLDRFYGAMHIFYRKHFNSNFLVNIMAHTGLSLGKFFRKISLARAKVATSSPSEAFVITDNLNLLKSLSETLSFPLKSASKVILNDNDFKDTLFIFDEDYMSYSQIFLVMDRLKNRGNQFRIRPAGCNFMLGSDKSDEKGTVVVF
ncbi:MAG: glycosyltransferase family 2 protein [Bacteroidia bacterium]|nr:glycosyltransferase family 2 protein [Bacteroidia bacterium]NNF29870.1 glycosyltransferase [Flavobacteriaceae bacterium]MBT8277065.1 glycosyltransferase family 2 protein [Bacteroidia bacterium]NNJ82300.1 glycosyltransferase [Flavobacteriaceae bacterium]NNK54165.1 glycosyltransferase [Flavobacteriaceae bacterium]